MIFTIYYKNKVIKNLFLTNELLNYNREEKKYILINDINRRKNEARI